MGSFSPRRLNHFRRLTRGRVPTSAHPLEVIAFRFLPSGRLADLLTRGRVAALQIPHRRGPLTVATRGLVRRAHAAGKHVHVWTVDDADEIRALLDRGVDGVMTDRTDILKEVLVQRDQWMSDGREGMSEAAGGVADLRPLARAREQRAWYWYDWANSAYTTTIGTVFFGPYFISLAENAVGEGGRFDVGMFSLPPGRPVLLADHAVDDPLRAAPPAARGLRRPHREQEGAARLPSRGPARSSPR